MSYFSFGIGVKDDSTNTDKSEEIVVDQKDLSDDTSDKTEE
jgi:hypothetical protein